MEDPWYTTDVYFKIDLLRKSLSKAILLMKNALGMVWWGNKIRKQNCVSPVGNFLRWIVCTYVCSNQQLPWRFPTILNKGNPYGTTFQLLHMSTFLTFLLYWVFWHLVFYWRARLMEASDYLKITRFISEFFTGWLEPANRKPQGNLVLPISTPP